MVRDFFGLFFIAAALLFAVYSIVETERLQQREIEKRRALEHLSSMRSSIEHRIQANVLVLRALKPEILWQDTPDRSRLQKILDEFLTTELDISHLALAPELRISFIYPRAGNEQLLGTDYRNVREQYHEILRAIGGQDIILSSPVNLLQGGTAFIARLPIFQADGSFWGIASLVIDHEHLFHEIGFYDHPEYQFVVYRQSLNNGADIISGDAAVLELDPIKTDVQVPGDQWQLAVAPRRGSWLDTEQGYLVHWLTGLAVTALIVAAFAVLILTQRRLRFALHTISFQARFDPLTGLANRNYFHQQLEQRIADAQNHNKGFALLMLDLDHLRDINDALGQDVGDGLLQHVAEQLGRSIRPQDIAARVGGDEFMLALADVDTAAHAEQRGKAIINDLLNTADIQQNHINVTASLGIALYPDDATHAQQLVKCAELAMYAAKAMGSLSVACYDRTLRQNTEQHIALHHQMIHALENNQFHVEYQPVIDTVSGLLTRCEALIRWDHPEHGNIPPGDFIPIAEKTGAIVWLGDFVLQQVMTDWQIMRAAGLDLTVAVNRSPREFHDKDVASEWLEALQEANMPPNRLMLEITESMLMRNQERQLMSLRRLRSAGVHLAIDDFGTGYSSLNYLRFYPIDVIKIDREFMKGVPANRQQKALVDVLIRIAHTLDLMVVAEGVETRAQVEFLQSKNCHFQQGFYYGQSLRLDTFIDYTKRFNQRVSR